MTAQSVLSPRLFVATLWLAGVCFAPASAQTPTIADPVPGLEVWQGNRRVDPNRSAVRLVSPTPADAPGVELPALGTAEATQSPPPAVLPQTPARVVPEIVRDTTGIDEIQQLIRTTRLLTEECQSAIKTCRATAEKVRQYEAEAPAPIRLTPVAPAPEPPPHKDRDADEPRPAAPMQVTSEGMSWAQVGLLAGAVLACPLLVVLLAAVFVRRTGLQFRVEVVNSGPMIARLESGWAGQPMPQFGPAPLNQPGETPTTDEPVLPPELEFTGEEFDLGPTYEEERLAKEEALKQQEQALLQQVFEDNCRLHEELACIDEVGYVTEEPCEAE